MTRDAFREEPWLINQAMNDPRNPGRFGARDISDFEADLVAKVMQTRGSLVSGYAHIEFLLADFAVQCSKRQDCAHLYEGFPYSLEARMRAALTLLKKAAFLKPYRPRAKPLVERLAHWKSLRDMMAHGFLVIETAADCRQRLLFQLYEPAGDRGYELKPFTTDYNALARAANDLTDFVHAFVLLWREIYFDQGLTETA